MPKAGRVSRPFILAAAFGCYFAFIMFESWTFASGLQSPWYGADLSRWVYMSFIVASAIFLMGAGILAFHIMDALGNRVREINRELGILLWDGGTSYRFAGSPTTATDPEETNGSSDPTSADLDEMLEVLGEADAQGGREVLVGSTARGTVEESDSVDNVQEIMWRRSLLRKRQGLKQHQDYLLRFLPGPLGVAAGIFGVSAAMLPASDGMLQTSYHLNTFLILGFSYAWIGLAAYFAASICGVVISSRTERKRVVNRAEE